MKTVLAVDLGAESGRVMAVRYDGARLELEELHRFPNVPVTIGNALLGERRCWDVLGLWANIQQGLARGMAERPAAIGVDTWGVDFALLDASGKLQGAPVHYRDRRTEGVMERVVSRLGRETIFEQTGIQFMSINTLYQLASLAERQAPELGLAQTFLTMPDLFNFWLTGARGCELTNASTTQLYNPRACRWAHELMEAVGIPAALFPEIIPPGTILGRHQGVPVVAPGCHDTASAVAGAPLSGEGACYISSGTWSLVGLELDRPIINQAALAANVTNEAGVYGSTRLLKNVMGLWIIQQCRASWQAQGHDYSYADLARMAEAAPPLRSLIPPNDPRLLAAGDHPAHVLALCAEHGQPAPEGHGAIVRCVLESLALAYREVIETLASLSGRSIDVIHMVGGGINNELLCQLTADATGLPVLAGPAEATVLGNALVQLIALGDLASLEEGRALIDRSFPPRRYEPNNTEAWSHAYEMLGARG